MWTFLHIIFTELLILSFRFWCEFERKVLSCSKKPNNFHFPLLLDNSVTYFSLLRLWHQCFHLQKPIDLSTIISDGTWKVFQKQKIRKLLALAALLFLQTHFLPSRSNHLSMNTGWPKSKFPISNRCSSESIHLGTHVTVGHLLVKPLGNLKS